MSSPDSSPGARRDRGARNFSVSSPVRLAGLALLATFTASAAPPPPRGLQLQLPVACRVGVDCFVQNHFDHDPGPGAKDHRCGSMTYDGHDGVDIRLPTTAAQRRGVAVLAAADGVVRGVRDGQPDRPVTDAAGRAAVKDRECGNGVAITHPGGWETQYCHMARGSVAVKPGQTVEAGQRLGSVGLSGWTQFPHAHLAVRRNGREVDPFTGHAEACGRPGQSLWAPEAAAALAYVSPQVINAGLAGAPIDMNAIEQAVAAAPTRASPVLVAYARVIGVETGDRISLALIGPNGADLARSETPPFDRPKAQQLNFVGARLKTDAWPAGRYRLEYRVMRGGKAVLTRRETLNL
jgi:murein DD-endopeptidase MepM/ murein hydrolase activator NlpD